MNNTIFDDVFRTMIEKMPYLAVPLINEVFHTSYPENVPIVQLRNEHQQENGEIITDSCLKIAGKLYHIECQSVDDTTMAIRMIEYDFSIAIENAQKQGKKNDHGNHGGGRHKQLILLSQEGVLQQSPGLGEHGLGFVHVQQGGAAHDGDIDGVEPGVDDDARQEAVNAHFRLQQGGDEAGEDSGGHGGQNGQVGMPGNGYHSTHSGTQSEAAVGGKVAYIEHGVAQKQCQHGQRADEAQLQGGLDQR